MKLVKRNLIQRDDVEMITWNAKGDFKKTSTFLKGIIARKQYRILDKYAQKGVEALQEATPKRTGLTASSWSYQIEQDASKISISWINSNYNKGVPVALVIQYGHGMPRGGFVKGIDYINPAMKPIFDELADMVWKEVSSL